MVNDILCGDALAVLKTLPDNFVQCVVTSPPYYGLRDYGVDGQIGLEETPQAFVAKLVEVFREVRRVLRPDGVCFVNIGDSYAGGGSGGASNKSTLKNDGRNLIGARNYEQQLNTTSFVRKPSAGFKPKDLLMIPARVAIAMQDDGWYLRQEIVWNKPTAMPESVLDRCTRSHEYVYMLTKRERYFYDAEAIKEPSVSTHPSGNGFKREARLSYLNPDGTARGNDQQWQVAESRNRRSVWNIATQPYAEAHFATMPPKLVEPCILAGTAPKACEHCGAPWQRVTVSTGHVNKREQAHAPYSTPTKTDSTGWAPTRRATDQWLPSCKCANNTGSGKCVVLDCFMGAGTVGLVALQHSRNYLGIELNPAYIELARKRIATVQPTLWSAIGESEVSA